jgi:NAD/NADP transhydrogenase beta subunit
MTSGHAGIDDPHFCLDKTTMVFGDAKKVVEDSLKRIE